MNAPPDERFRGWGAFSKTAVNGELREFAYSPKPWEETDVDIEIMYTGVCGSDLSTMRSGWADVDYPQEARKLTTKVLGHEIVGKAIRVGSAVTHVQVGDIVGVGAQCDSCGSCTDCQDGAENYCAEGWVGTYDGKFNKGAAKGHKSYGGYANTHRCPGHFVIPIPSNLYPAYAAPLMCGGSTVYQPLVRYGAGKTAKSVGIVGLGGLGHFAVLFAKAMGAKVTVITHSPGKVEDAKALGAGKVLVTHGDEDVLADYSRSLDLVLITSNDKQMPIESYLKLLKRGGYTILVGEPEAPLPSFSGFALSANGVHLGGSCIAPSAQIREMLQFAADKQIKPWIVKRPLNEVNEVIRDFASHGARYRYVLVNEKNGGLL